MSHEGNVGCASASQVRLTGGQGCFVEVFASPPRVFCFSPLWVRRHLSLTWASVASAGRSWGRKVCILL